MKNDVNEDILLRITGIPAESVSPKEASNSCNPQAIDVVNQLSDIECSRLGSTSESNHAPQRDAPQLRLVWSAP